ncbi:MAG: site-specific integrase [Oscillatoriophycideae cyanobacterium NC_groundwater_1537_Pr4_S-0.65um_50_18]|nr:site-specific integrase [Oscillatoriophycideae cyanobacterium NC_groundwater_1537_Pr4_S-0.65um_50_18]
MKPIRVHQNKTSCSIRWTYKDERYSLTWGNYSNAEDRARLEICARQIYVDCLAGEFDSTLQRYRYWLIGAIAPSSSGNGNGNGNGNGKTHKESEPVKPSLVFLLEQRLEDNYNSADQSLLYLLKRYEIPIDSKEEAQRLMTWMKTRGNKATTLKRYLAIMQILRRDLFGEIKVRREERPSPKPLTQVEVQQFLLELEENQYYRHYLDFFILLFNTGMRLSEAIGLRWQDCDLKAKEIQVYETLSRTKGNPAKRQRKTTKTGKYRIVPMNNKVHSMLLKRSQSKQGELIFYSPKGLTLNDHMINQRCWSKTLEQLGIPHRPLRITRTTFASHCVSSGIDPVDVARITGHDVRILYEHYLGSVVRRPKLPEL